MSSTAIRRPLDIASKIIAIAAIVAWFAVKSITTNEPFVIEANPWIWFKQASEAIGYSAVTVVAFRWLFEKYLWRWRLFRHRLVQFPDMTGTWYARFESKTFGTKFFSVVKLDHRFDRLIYSDFRAVVDKITGDIKIVSTSHVRTWSLERIAQDDSVHLYVIYDNVPGDECSKEKYGKKHSGCLALRLHNENESRDKWILKGDYWTTKAWPFSAENSPPPARFGGTLGTVEMKWTKSSLASTFDGDALIYLHRCPELQQRDLNQSHLDAHRN